MSYHAVISPSSASRWKDCTASIGAQQGLKDDGSDAARWGTTAHEIGSRCLQSAQEPHEFLGRVLTFSVSPWGGDYRQDQFLDEIDKTVLAFGQITITHRVNVTQEMVECCETYVDFVRELHALNGGRLEIEQRVPIGHITGELDAGGTSDTTLILPTHVYVCDLKGGMSQVDAFEVVTPGGTDLFTGDIVPPVLAPNDQLAMYADGSIEKFGLRETVETITLIIVQPRLRHISQHTLTKAELAAHIQGLREAAERTRTNPVFSPSSDNCHFCKASGACAAQRNMVYSQALVGFDTDEPSVRAIPVDELGKAYGLMTLISDYLSAISGRVFVELHSGRPVTTPQGVQYKLVKGKAVGRKWGDEAAAEGVLRASGVPEDVMFTKKLVSPTTIDELSHPKKARKGKPAVEPLLTEEQWAAAESLMHRPESGTVIVLETDPRPALTPWKEALDGFDDDGSFAANCQDLF